MHVEIGHAENFSMNGYGNCRYGWIADEKFKISVYDKNPGQYPSILPEYVIWLDIKFGDDTFFEKEKRDIMNWMIWKNPNYFVLSCHVTFDKNQSKISLQYYTLVLGKGWIKSKHFYYSSLSDFDSFSAQEKGEFGEALGKIFGKRLLFENRTLFFPEFNEEFLRIEDGISIDCSKREPSYYEIPDSNRVTDQRRMIFSGWVPDNIFQVLTSPDNTQLKYETFPKKIVFLEIKTGKNARFERNQKNDIETMSYDSNCIVLLCSIIPEYIETSESKLVRKFILNFQMMKNCEWKAIQKYYYSDFQELLKS